MTEGKSTNLLKAAKELNIGISTAVDFLKDKGFDVEAKPTTKLSAEMYDVLSRKFQGDKIAKDEAKQIVIGKIRREEAPSSGSFAPAQESATSKNDEVENEILIKNPLVTSPVAKEEPAKEVKEDTHSGSLKVVGKIDLDSLNKPKAKKVEETIAEQKPVETPVVVKKEEPKPEPIKEEVKEEPKVEAKPVQVEKVEQTPVKEQSKPVQEVIAAKVEPKVEEKPAPKPIVAQAPIITPPAEPVAVKKEDDVIRARSEKLEGPKVIGKIELPTFKPKEKPVASSSNSNEDNKRKRKRTNKPGTPVSPNDQNNQQHGGQNRPHGGGPYGQNRQQGGQPGQHGQNRPGGPSQGGPRGNNTNNNVNRPGGNNNPANRSRFDNRGKGGRNDAP